MSTIGQTTTCWRAYCGPEKLQSQTVAIAPLTLSVGPHETAMSYLTQNEPQFLGESARPESTSPDPQTSLRVLFVHLVAEVIESCLRELENGRFTVSSDIALSSAHCAEQLRCHIYEK
jgi:hypothetical protein